MNSYINVKLGAEFNEPRRMSSTVDRLPQTVASVELWLAYTYILDWFVHSIGDHSAEPWVVQRIISIWITQVFVLKQLQVLPLLVVFSINSKIIWNYNNLVTQRFPLSASVGRSRTRSQRTVHVRATCWHCPSLCLLKQRKTRSESLDVHSYWSQSHPRTVRVYPKKY